MVTRIIKEYFQRKGQYSILEYFFFEDAFLFASLGNRKTYHIGTLRPRPYIPLGRGPCSIFNDNI